jgi:hypothetical protein
MGFLASQNSVFLVDAFQLRDTLRFPALTVRGRPDHSQTEKPLMKKKSASRSAFFNPRVLISFAFCAIGVLLALLAFALYPGGNAFARQNQSAAPAVAQDSAPVLEGGLTEEQPSAPTIPITPLVESGKIDATEQSPCSIINGSGGLLLE